MYKDITNNVYFGYQYVFSIKLRSFTMDEATIRSVYMYNYMYRGSIHSIKSKVSTNTALFMTTSDTDN